MSAAARMVIVSLEDSVGVCIEGAAVGESVVGPSGVTVVASQRIPAGHKIALRDHEAGAHVVKYGESIGIASQPITTGSHVHVHNLRSGRVGGEDTPQ